MLTERLNSMKRSRVKVYEKRVKLYANLHRKESIDYKSWEINKGSYGSTKGPQILCTLGPFSSLFHDLVSNLLFTVLNKTWQGLE